MLKWDNKKLTDYSHDQWTRNNIICVQAISFYETRNERWLTSYYIRLIRFPLLLSKFLPKRKSTFKSWLSFFLKKLRTTFWKCFFKNMRISWIFQKIWNEPIDVTMYVFINIFQTLLKRIKVGAVALFSD